MFDKNAEINFMVLGCVLKDEPLFPLMPVFARDRAEAEDALYNLFVEIMKSINNPKEKYATKYKNVNVYSDTDFIQIFGTPCADCSEEEDEDWDEDSEKEVCIASLEIHEIREASMASDIAEKTPSFRDNGFVKPIAEHILSKMRTSLGHETALNHIMSIIRKKGNMPCLVQMKNHDAWAEEYAKEILEDEVLVEEIRAVL